jgi:hypothetical protein
MTDPTRQERNDFQPTPSRSHPDAVERGRDYEDAEDEARNRGDFTDPRVVQPGEAEPDAPSDEPLERPGERPR